MSNDYPEFWNLGPYKYPFYRSKLYNFFQLYARKASLVLDAGCGDKGGYAIKIPKNVQGIGLDIDRRNVKKSVEKSKNLQLCHLSFLQGTLENLPFVEKTFDVIICCDVLEHVENPEKAIRELAFSLKKGGKLLICTTNEFNPAMFLDGILPKKVSATIIRQFGGAHHYERTRRLNPWSFWEKLNRYGLKLEKLLMFGYPPFGQPWIYHYSKVKPSIIFYFWIIFDRLTKIGFLKRFKEEMLVIARL